MRELNTVINNYDNIKRKVVFVYAIKDDMFKDEDRTKFFDFIIPVIPYINATNSGEILRDLLEFEKDENGIYKSKKYDITDRYIGEISPFIQDMRVLTNICNEFLVYKRTLKMTKLKDHEMFSMIAFKNLYPKEFAELEAEKGIVKQIFKGKREFVVGKKMGIEEKIAPKKEILENVHNDILWGMRDIKHAFLGFLSDENGTRYPVSELEINNRSYTSLNEERFYVFLNKITAFIFGYAFIRPGVNALRSPVYPEMINIVSDLPVTFVGYEFDIDNVRNIMSSYVFTNGRPITKSILAWWAYTDASQELISLDTNLEIEHIYPKKRQENEESLCDKSSLESLGNKALLEKNINIRASDYRFTDKIKYYQGYTTSSGKQKTGTKVYELQKLSNSVNDYTEKDIVDRKNRIIEGFLHYLEKNELMDK